MTSMININGETRNSTDLTLPQNRDFRGAWALNGDVVEIDINKAKPIARAKVNGHRNEQKHKPFTVAGLGEFSADEDSKVNIDGAAQAALMAKLGSQPFAIEWSLHNGDPITLDADQMQAVGLALMDHINVAHTEARTKKQIIDDATTFAEIETVLASLE